MTELQYEQKIERLKKENIIARDNCYLLMGMVTVLAQENKVVLNQVSYILGSLNPCEEPR